MWSLQYLLIISFISFGTTSHLNPSVIIVGSGPSGIAAATRLLKNNYTNIKILEAENRIGGRIFSTLFGDAYVDIGAEYCHGEENNIVLSMVKDFNILRHSTPDFTFLRSNGEIVDQKTGNRIFDFADQVETLEEIHPECKNVISAGVCLKIRSIKFIKSAENIKETEIFEESYDFVKNYVATSYSAMDLRDLNITSHFKISEGDLRMNWNGLGFKTILEVMMQKYPDASNQIPIDDKIYLNKEVVTITNWKNDTISITTEDGNRYEADHVIFTPSIGVLKANYKDLFKPKLPGKKIEAIKDIGFGAILKIILHFNERWWKNDPLWPLLWTHSDKMKLREINLEWLKGASGINQNPNNSKVFTIWFSGEFIPHIETLSDDEILRGSKHLLTSFLSSRYNVTTPDKIIKTSWYSNPHFKGTYSYDKTLTSDKLRYQLNKPLLKSNQAPSLLFAGEATHPHYFSTVHGAIESGYREADRLLKYYKEN